MVVAQEYIQKSEVKYCNFTHSEQQFEVYNIEPLRGCNKLKKGKFNKRKREKIIDWDIDKNNFCKASV